MVNIISFIVLLLCCWAQIFSNICLLKKNVRLIDLLNEKNRCIEHLMDILVQHGYYDKNTFGELYNAALEHLKSINVDTDNLTFDVKSIELFETLMKSKGCKRPVDDILFIDHEEFIPFEYNGNSYVIEIYW